MPPQITCASALSEKAGTTKIAFFTCCISALPELNQSLLDFFNLFDSRRYACVVYAMAMCLRVCLSVYPTQAEVLSKRLNISSCTTTHNSSRNLWFSDAKHLDEIRMGLPPTRRQMHVAYTGKITTFDTQLAISQKRYNIDT